MNTIKIGERAYALPSPGFLNNLAGAHNILVATGAVATAFSVLMSLDSELTRMKVPDVPAKYLILIIFPIASVLLYGFLMWVFQRTFPKAFAPIRSKYQPGELIVLCKSVPDGFDLSSSGQITVRGEWIDFSLRDCEFRISRDEIELAQFVSRGVLLKLRSSEPRFTQSIMVGNQPKDAASVSASEKFRHDFQAMPNVIANGVLPPFWVPCFAYTPFVHRGQLWSAAPLAALTGYLAMQGASLFSGPLDYRELVIAPTLFTSILLQIVCRWSHIKEKKRAVHLTDLGVPPVRHLHTL